MNKKEWIKPEIHQMFTHIFVCTKYEEDEEPEILKVPVEKFLHMFNLEKFTSENCFVTKDIETMRKSLGVSKDYKLNIIQGEENE